MRSGTDDRQLEPAAGAGPDLGPPQHEHLPQRLGQLQQELVHRDRPAEPAAPGAQHLVGGLALAVDEPVGRLGQPLAGGDVGERGDGGGQHREHEQRALAVGGGAAEPDHDDQVDEHDDRGEARGGHGVHEQPVDPAGDRGCWCRRRGRAARGRWRRRRPRRRGWASRPGSAGPPPPARPRRSPPPRSRRAAAAGGPGPRSAGTSGGPTGRPTRSAPTAAAATTADGGHPTGQRQRDAR